jgi:hypothetical protein
MDGSMKTLPITHVATTDLSEMLDPRGGKRMQLPGFDSEFVDFPDYIIRITDRIWHDRKVEMIYDYYAKDCIVHTQAGTGIGVEPVVEGTRATMRAFPDRVLDADNVIWSEDKPQAGSPNPVFYSSHLITSNMTNEGPSEFGPATGNKVRVITIADCACRDNVIFEEWLVRDYAAIVEQLGFDVLEIAKILAKSDIEEGRNVALEHSAKIKSICAADRLKSTDDDFFNRFFASIFQDKDWGRLSEFYDFRVGARHPYGRDLYGPAQVKESLETLISPLSDIQVSLDHICEIPYLGEARDVAIRWSIAAKHLETQADIYILGVSQFRMIRGRIREEVTMWDDVAIQRMLEGIRLRD